MRRRVLITGGGRRVGLATARALAPTCDLVITTHSDVEAVRRTTGSLPTTVDVVPLDLTQLTTFTDYFVIATVDNIRQARAIEEAVSDAAAKRGHKAKVEGAPEDGWILVDAGDGIFVHLFSLEARVYYDLEGLWHRAQEIVRVQ